MVKKAELVMVNKILRFCYNSDLNRSKIWEFPHCANMTHFNKHDVALKPSLPYISAFPTFCGRYWPRPSFGFLSFFMWSKSVTSSSLGHFYFKALLTMVWFKKTLTNWDNISSFKLGIWVCR